MTAKTVHAPGLLADLMGSSAFASLDGPVLLLIAAVAAASFYAALMVLRN